MVEVVRQDAAGLLRRRCVRRGALFGAVLYLVPGTSLSAIMAWSPSEGTAAGQSFLLQCATFGMVPALCVVVPLVARLLHPAVRPHGELGTYTLASPHHRWCVVVGGAALVTGASWRGTACPRCRVLSSRTMGELLICCDTEQ